MTAAVLPASIADPGFDRILELEPGLRAVAIRNIPGTLPVFADHFPRYPIMPGVLLLEGMIALAGRAAGAGEWRLRTAEAVRFRRFVVPGDQVVFTVEAAGYDADSGLWCCTATVDGRVVASARTLRLVRMSPRGTSPA
ncbi:3-hydroxyacyl-ACP dehydratase FabZ family protein [Nocardia transvalensis]|uniref:3-hydroxyacyl-ACP dehydratase FabZ family protein n=1 Tax=Nocardia transvalensis TaxID=37333 RepID=UPI001892DE44|nr:hydroxymyristoyl-ACP dehydratase [Nocardia transvalensis]MBF6329920.1 hydroxymyristoyl-ACP dehydratase [Nocardia transvalensis]